MNNLPWRSLLLVAVVISLVLTGAHSVGAAEDEEKGVWFERRDGSKLNLLVEENNFELHFYDEEKEVIEPDVNQAIVHFTPKFETTRITVALDPAEKEYEDEEEGELVKTILTSPRHIQAPLQFQILLVLMLDEAGDETENFSIYFRQNADDPLPEPPPDY